MNRKISVLCASAAAGALALAVAACGGSSSPAPTAQSSALAAQSSAPPAAASSAPASSAPSTGIPVVTAGHPATFTFTQLDVSTGNTVTVVETYALDKVISFTSDPSLPGYKFLALQMTVRNESQYQVSAVPGFDQWVSGGSTTPAGGNGPIQNMQEIAFNSLIGPSQVNPLENVGILYPGQSATGEIVYRVPSSPGFLEETATGRNAGYQVNQFGAVSSVLVEMKY
jgi:hypothetical protein